MKALSPSGETAVTSLVDPLSSSRCTSSLSDMARWWTKGAVVLVAVGLTFLLGLIVGLHIGRSERSAVQVAALTPCEQAVADAASSSTTASVTGLFRAVG